MSALAYTGNLNTTHTILNELLILLYIREHGAYSLPAPGVIDDDASDWAELATLT